MSSTPPEERAEIVAAKARLQAARLKDEERRKRGQEIQRQYDEALRQIPRRMQASAWLKAQPQDIQQAFLKQISGKLTDAVGVEEGIYIGQPSYDTVGFAEGFLAKLPTDENVNNPREVSCQNSDGESIKIQIKLSKGAFFLIEHEESHPVRLNGDVLEKIVSFDDILDKALADFQIINSPKEALDDAIATKNFKLINRIIGEIQYSPTDTQIIQLMRLSNFEKKGSIERTPTFLHRLLDPKTGLTNSKTIIPLLNRAKELLTEYEFNALLDLSDGTKSAKELFSSSYDKEIHEALRKLLPQEFIANDRGLRAHERNTHDAALSFCVQVASTNLYREFQQRHPKIVPTNSSKSKKFVSIKRNKKFKEFIDARVLKLLNRLTKELTKSDEELAPFVRSMDKSIEAYKFELVCAIRFMYDCVAVGQVTSGRYEIEFNKVYDGTGLTPKETIAMVFDTLEVGENLILTSDSPEEERRRHFARFVTYLKEIRREYNERDVLDEEDRGKCIIGTMNHLIYSLQSIYSPTIVDIISLTDTDLARLSYEKANDYLISYLEGLQGEEKETLRSAIAKMRVGFKPQDALPEEILKSLQEAVLKSMKQAFEKYFKDDEYLTKVQQCMSFIPIQDKLTQKIGSFELPNLFPNPSDLVQAMKNDQIPLYIRTEEGYGRILGIVKSKYPDYYTRITEALILSGEFELLRKYGVDNYKELLVDACKSPLGTTEKNKLLHPVMEYFFHSKDEDVLKSIKAIAPEEFKNFLRHKLMGNYGTWYIEAFEIDEDDEFNKSPEYFINLLHRNKMSKARKLLDDLPDSALNPDMLRAVMNYHDEPMALSMVNRMSSDQHSIPNENGETVLFYASDQSSALVLAMINKMSPAQLSIKSNQGSALFSHSHFNDIVVPNTLLEKMPKEALLIQNDYKETILHRLSEPSYFYSAEALRQERKNFVLSVINKTPPEGFGFQEKRFLRTPLMKLLESHQNELAIEVIARMLPKDLHLKNKHGMTAYQYTQYGLYKNGPIARELSPKNIQLLSMMHQLFQNKALTPTQVLLKIFELNTLESLSSSAKIKIRLYLQEKNEAGLSHLETIDAIKHRKLWEKLLVLATPQQVTQYYKSVLERAKPKDLSTAEPKHAEGDVGLH